MEITDILLGKGSYAKVYLAFGKVGVSADTAVGGGGAAVPSGSVGNSSGRSRFACKIINKVDLSSEGIRNIQREIHIHKRLRHRNIVYFYSNNQDYHNIYIFLEFCDHDLTRVHRNIDCRHFMLDVLNGIKYLHNKNIIHRDIKPYNILIVENEAKIADFGYAIKYDGELLYDYLHTPNYVSPEILGSLGYSFPTDIWSYGVTLYWSITKKEAFQDEKHDKIETYRNILKLKYNNSMLSDTAQDLISKILVSNPHQRLSIAEISAHPFFS